MQIAQSLKTLMKANAVSSYHLAKETGVRTSTVTGWLTGRQPQLAQLKKIADYFHVSQDYLSGKTQEKTVPLIPARVVTSDTEMQGYLDELRINPDKRMFFSLTKNASKEDVEMAVRMVAAFLKSKEF